MVQSVTTPGGAFGSMNGTEYPTRWMNNGSCIASEGLASAQDEGI
jgi:hypothetical protein